MKLCKKTALKSGGNPHLKLLSNRTEVRTSNCSQIGRKCFGAKKCQSEHNFVRKCRLAHTYPGWLQTSWTEMKIQKWGWKWPTFWPKSCTFLVAKVVTFLVPKVGNVLAQKLTNLTVQFEVEILSVPRPIKITDFWWFWWVIVPINRSRSSPSQIVLY